MIVSKFRILPIVLFSTVLAAQQIQVRIDNRISSETARPGNAFQGVLVQPVNLGGRSCARNSPVGGVISEAKSSGRLKGPGVLVLEPQWVSCGGRRVNVSAEPIRLEGASHTKRNAVLIGGGAGAGALLGGLIGGGKGALIGAAVGAGTGTVGAAATGKHEAVIEPEAVVGWNLNSASNSNAYQNSAPRRESDYARSQQPSRHSRHDDDDDDDRYGDRDGGRDYRFTEHDRVYLRRCLGSNYRLPPGLAKQGKIPPGHAKKMQRYGEPIPGACMAELSPIPRGWDRIIVAERVVLIDPFRREVDFFIWQR
ncbi:MAG TPA: hypothetical protein VN577_06120 [Terriglobales bacterium]|nr:hypothetical protein [Terriglobales bacterium]